MNCVEYKRVAAVDTLDRFKEEWKNQKTSSINLTELITHRSVKIYPKRDLVILHLTNTSRDLKCVIDAVEESPCDPLAE